MRIMFAVFLFLLCGASSFGGGAAWTAWHDYQEASFLEQRAEIQREALHALRTDPVACSRGIPAARNLCVALARYDIAAQSVAAWADPADRPDVAQTLSIVRETAIMTDAPSWVPPLQWAEEAALRRARALEAALAALSVKTETYEKAALSSKLADILKDKLLQDSSAP